MVPLAMESRRAVLDPATGNAVSETGRVCEVFRPGRLEYDDAVRKMEQRVSARRFGLVPDALVLLEHDPVITFGRNAKPENLLASRDRLARRGISLRECGRGGDVTYHGPGQLATSGTSRRSSSAHSRSTA
jgi:lipoate-protein ligase B